jgi:membrane protease YdiL (CAAX protease family)
MKYCFCIALIFLTFTFAEEALLSQPSELTTEEIDSNQKVEEEIAFLEPTELAIERMDPNLFETKPAPDQRAELNYLPPKNPAIAVTLSSLVPGLGNSYLGDNRTAGAIFGSAAGFITAGSLSENETFQISNLTMASNTWFYGMYAAYRDARAYNNDYGYSYSMPNDSFADLSFASFQWSVISKPEVWGGLLGTLAAAVGVGYLMGGGADEDEDPSLSSTGRNYPLNAFSVGIGEEAFFRGVLMPAFTEMWGPRGGLIASSLVFGAAHIPNGFDMDTRTRNRYYMFGIPFITAIGGYMGWMAQKNNSLKESVAYHSWYDFILFLGAYSATSSITNQKPTFALSLSF